MLEIIERIGQMTPKGLYALCLTLFVITLCSLIFVSWIIDFIKKRKNKL